MNLVRVGREIAFSKFKEWSAYRLSMMISLLTGPIFFLVQYSIWTALFQFQETIQGFTLDEILIYYAVISFIMYLLWDNVHDDIERWVHQGSFVIFMIRPLSHLYYGFCNKLGHRSLALLIEAIPMYFLFLLLFKILLVPHTLHLAIISILLAFVMTYLINYCVGLLAFWFTKVHGIKWLLGFFKGLFSGVVIPLLFFPGILQKVLFFLPFQWAYYVPVRVWIGSYELAGYTFSISQIVILQAIAVFVMYLFTLFVYRLALKRFTGVGV